MPDDEVDLRVEDLVDQGLVGGDSHLAAAVAVVADLLVLVLLNLEAGDRPLVLDQADDVAAIRVEDGVDLGLQVGVLLDQLLQAPVPKVMWRPSSSRISRKPSRSAGKASQSLAVSITIS